MQIPQQTTIVNNAYVKIQLLSTAVEEAGSLIGKKLHCHQTEGGSFVMAEGVSALEPVNSFSAYLVEKGIARVDEEYNGNHAQALLELEAEASAA